MRSAGKNFFSIISFFVLLCAAQIVSAGNVRETIVYLGVPSSKLVEQWASGPAQSYLFFLDVDVPADFLRVLEIKNAVTLQVSTNTYPSSRSLPAWKQLAAHGAQLVVQGNDVTFPTVLQAGVMDAAGFQQIVFTFARYPIPEDGDNLGLLALRTPHSLNFSINRFPLSQDVAALKQLSTVTRFRFATDYWPRSSQTQLLAELGRPVALFVVNQTPTTADLAHLSELISTQEILLELAYGNLPNHFWKSFTEALPNSSVKVKWSSRQGVPTANELASFFESGTLETRTFTLDRDDPLTKAELERLKLSPGNIEWIH